LEQSITEKHIPGTGVSPGIAIGRASVIGRKIKPGYSGQLLHTEAEQTLEIEKYDRAVLRSAEELDLVKKTLQAAGEQEAAEIIDSHIELLTDPQIREDVLQKIDIDKKNASDALMEVIRAAVELFDSMQDEYMRARGGDIKDVGDRLIRNINSFPGEQVQRFESETIIVAEELSPSDTLAMDTARINGFVTATGSRTSHAAIIARSKGIPAVLGCGDLWTTIRDNDFIIVDGEEGIVIVNPSEETRREYLLRQEVFNSRRIFLQSLKDRNASTIDGTLVTLQANISGEEDVEVMIAYGGVGSGLFRTEMMYMNRDSFPSEEEQFSWYKKIALKAGSRPITVRTIDIGGDKHLPYFGLPVEQNPFLGYRAIRICLDRRELFVAQLKAILRAAVFGNLKIMFPMISSVRELRQAKAILEEAKSELLQQNIKFEAGIRVGIMIEIPSAAITADILAKEVDFFSIGTNDLCQYTLAVDRMNEKIKDLYDPFDPAVLRLIRNVIQQADRHHIEVGMCGELASDPLATRLLLGMGLKDFSMSAASIPVIKNIIIQTALPEAEALMEKVMQIDNSASILACLKEANQ
jgi:phosphoenolpyruvate-protein phosphotransferase (PTS system enzyme I)